MWYSDFSFIIPCIFHRIFLEIAAPHHVITATSHDRHIVSNRIKPDNLFNNLSWSTSKKTSNLRITSAFLEHYGDIIMSAMASQITGVSMICSTVCSGADQRMHQSSASLAFERGIHRWPVNSPHKRPVTRKMFPFDDVIMDTAVCWLIPLTKGQYYGKRSHVMTVCRTEIG